MEDFNFIETLKEAGRYEQVMETLLLIACNNNTYLPVRPYFQKGEAISRVLTSDLRAGIRYLLKKIKSNTRVAPGDEGGFSLLSPLEQYISSEADIKMHNYANMCSHKKVALESDLEEIRVYSIIHSIICYMENPEWDDIWEIPEGWKAYKEEDSD